MSRVRNIKSFETFSNRLRDHRPQVVAVQADRRPVKGLLFGTSSSTTVGELGNYDHGLVYTVLNAKKQKMHREPLFTAFQSEYGVGDRVERNNRIMAILLAGEIRVGELSLILADAQVYLAGSDLQPLSADKLDKLHRQAGEYGIGPPNFVV